MQTGSAVAAAHFLLQSAEVAFPKQKKSLVVMEFKQAKVAHKRRSKAHREEKGKTFEIGPLAKLNFHIIKFRKLIM